MRQRQNAHTNFGNTAILPSIDEFPYDTEEAYLQGANNVINNPDALHKLEEEDGDDVYFVEDTNEFVVVSTDGYIRTYFIADIDYYNRQ